MPPPSWTRPAIHLARLGTLCEACTAPGREPHIFGDGPPSVGSSAARDDGVPRRPSESLILSCVRSTRQRHLCSLAPRGLSRRRGRGR
eukprot:6462895-Pyramimonas_sp.AAC.1